MKKRGEQIMEAIITVIIVLLVCIVIWYISTSNGIKRSQLKVEEAESESMWHSRSVTMCLRRCLMS